MFFVLFLLTAACFVWMHWTVVHMLHTQSPELAGRLENPYDDRRPGLGMAHDRLPEEARA